MRFQVDIACDNAAFTIESNDENNGRPNPAPEVARILREAAEKVERMPDLWRLDTGIVLRDINGAQVGGIRFYEGEEMVGDQRAIDAIATTLGTAERWNADQLESIANIVGTVRPHPGGEQDYRPLFSDATGRNVVARYDRGDRDDA